MKSAILKLFNKEVVIKFLLGFFYSISSGQWDVIKAKVLEAEQRFTKPGMGVEKSSWVVSQVKALYYGLRTSAINYAIESAMALLINTLSNKNK